MKILIINKFLYPNGGAETYIFKLGEYLQSIGHEVQYFGMEHEGRCVGNRVEAYTSDMDFHNGSKLSKLTYPIKTIYSHEARTQIRKVLDDFCPDVCHLNNFNYQLTPSMILEIVKWRRRTGNKCKVLFTAHDYQIICPNHMMNNPATHLNCEKCVGKHFTNCVKGKCIHGSTAKSIIGAMEAVFWNAKGTYKYIDKIICCSEFMKSKMDTNPLFADKTVALHNFIEKPEVKSAEGSECESRIKASGLDVADECEIDSRGLNGADECEIDSRGLNGADDYVLYFGRFSWEKGVRTLIEAAKRLPEIKFVFAGSGEYANDMEGIPNIENVGFKSGEDLDQLIRNAKFSVCPSEWYENCPFSVMESQARGTVVIGARIGGIPELVIDGENGLLFESGNVSSLVDAIMRLWNDEALLEKFESACKALERDDVGQYVEKYLRMMEG